MKIVIIDGENILYLLKDLRNFKNIFSKDVTYNVTLYLGDIF